jgi:phosphomannomutase
MPIAVCRGTLTSEDYGVHNLMTETVNSAIFRAYDIRGLVDQDLTDNTLTILGKATGTWLRSWQAQTCVVGRDARCSSPRFQHAFIEGLRSTGIDVLDIGEVPTPVMYFAVEHLQVDSGAVISASHNPPEYNGVKLRRSHPTYGSEPVSGQPIQEIYAIANGGKFAQGNGSLKSHDVRDAYIQSVTSTLQLPTALTTAGNRPRVVLDGGNGVAGPVGIRVLEQLGVEVIPLYIEPDGTFPNHHPDPLKTENLRDLQHMVQTHGADLGLALDGDGDRLGVVDHAGHVVWPDRYLIVLAKHLLAKKAAAVVFDVKCSSVLADAVRMLGGTPVMSKTGYASISAKMRETQAVLGGELSGHTFSTYPRHYYDDGTFAAAHLIHALSHAGVAATTNSNRMLSLQEALTPYPMLPSLKDDRIHFSDSTKFQVVDYVREHFTGRYPILAIDGVRVDFGDGWGVVRASNTEPVITTGFEAATEERVQAIRTMMLEVIETFRRQR